MQKTTEKKKQGKIFCLKKITNSYFESDSVLDSEEAEVVILLKIQLQNEYKYIYKISYVDFFVVE